MGEPKKRFGPQLYEESLGVMKCLGTKHSQNNASLMEAMHKQLKCRGFRADFVQTSCRLRADFVQTSCRLRADFVPKCLAKEKQPKILPRYCSEVTWYARPMKTWEDLPDPMTNHRPMIH